jgi:hypothetical protein
VFLVTFVPTILAHSGVATTDMALTAMLTAALASGIALLEKPSIRRGALFGVCFGLAVLSKLTSLPFMAACAVAGVLLHLLRARPKAAEFLSTARLAAVPLGVALAVSALTIWAGYRFSVGPTPYTSFSVPAPGLFHGIAMVLGRTSSGHPSYLLGQRSPTGFWYYYPIALAVKLPLPFLALAGYGVIRCWKRGQASYWPPVAFAAAILAFGLSSPVNIGIRHVLPVVVFLGIAAAVGAKDLLHSTNLWSKRAAAVLLLWMAGTSLLSHPDYLPYFNAIAGDEPEKILVDSDLDWGQDMKRLATRLRQVNAQQVSFNPFILAHLEGVHGFPPIQPTDPVQPQPGWTAVSLTVLKTARLGLMEQHPEIDPWPNRVKPTERVGNGVYLYYFMPQQQGAR